MKTNIDNLTNKQKEIFVSRYLELLEKWKKEFKPSLIQRILSFCVRLAQGHILKKDCKSYFENIITKQKELLKFANSDAEKEIINCWINMDKETIKWEDQINNQTKLKSKQKILVKAFYNEKNFTNALNLYKNQIDLLNLSSVSNKSIMYKVRQQQRIYELSKQLEKNKSNKREILALGIITDILSRNDKLIGTTSALIYSTIKESEADFTNSILLTEKLKNSVGENRHRARIISEDITKLMKEVKNES